MIAKYSLRSHHSGTLSPCHDRLGCSNARRSHRSHFQVQRLPSSMAFAPGRRPHEVLGRPHAGLPAGGRPLLSRPSPPQNSPHGGPPSFCFRCRRPILLLADSIPVHDRHRPVSRLDRRRGHSRRSRLKLPQPAHLLVCSPLRTRSLHPDPRPP